MDSLKGSVHPENCMGSYIKMLCPGEVIRNIVLIFTDVCDKRLKNQ